MGWFISAVERVRLFNMLRKGEEGMPGRFKDGSFVCCPFGCETAAECSRFGVEYWMGL